MSFKVYKNSRFLFENDYFGGQELSSNEILGSIFSRILKL